MSDGPREFVIPAGHARLWLMRAGGRVTIVQTEGHQVGDLIAEIARRGVAILLVEQKLSIAMRISHRVYVMGHGRIVFEGTPADLTRNAAVRKEWLEV